MLRVTVNDVWSHKSRFVGMFTAVLVGVAFLAGTLVLGDTVRDSFGTLFTEANSGTGSVVRSASRLTGEDGTQQGLLDESLAGRVHAVDGVVAVSPSVEGTAQLIGADGERIGGNGPPSLGRNWIDETRLNPWHLVAGRAPAHDGEVIIDRRSADAGKLRVGGTTTVLVPQPVRVRVVGIAKFGSTDSMGGSTFTAFTTSEAQRLLLGREGVVTSLLVHGAPGVSQAQLVARVRPTLPEGVTQITGRQLTAEQRADVESDFVSFFEAALLVFAGVALLVAAFSIYNAFSIVTAQRTRQSALLRALGASRRQVLVSSAAQGLGVGAVASLAGVAAGIGLAAGLQAVLDVIDAGLPDRALVLDPARLALAATVGVVVALPASMLPALRASKVRPLAAIHEQAIGGARVSLKRTVSGIVITGLGAGLLVVGASKHAFEWSGPGALLSLVGLVLLGPAVARPAISVIGAPIRGLRGIAGSLARRNAMRSPRTTAGTATALMVGVAVVTLFTVFASTIKASIGETVRHSFSGELVVVQFDQSGVGMSPALVGQLDALPEVATATGFGFGPVTVDHEQRDVTAADIARLGRMVDLHVTAGNIAAADASSFAVSQHYAQERGLTVGAPIRVRFGTGASVPLRVAVIYRDRTNFGDVILPESQWAANTVQPMLKGVFVDLAPGTRLDEGRAAVERVTKPLYTPDVQDKDEYLADVGSQVDALLAIVYAFLALAILIAFMGIANTLSLAIHERTHELGLLRAVGLDRRQARAAIRWEAVMIALFGTAGGLACGLLVGWGLTRSFAGSLPLEVFAVPTRAILTIAVAGAVAGVLAAVRPARRAAKLPILTSLAQT
jgi:putative ABC transport system permease protein